MPLSREAFVLRWKLNVSSESQASQSHFIDLCEMLGVPAPAADPESAETYTFEKPVSKVYGGKGAADVWKRGYFAWEYKSRDRDLKAAYKQLNDYREDLGNPPLLVVSDMDRFEIHTNFINTTKRVYSFTLDDLKKNVVTPSCPLPPFDVLRALFADYNVLRPNRTDAYVTQEAAKTFARLAERLEIEKRALTDTPIHTREEIAHFLMRLLFCLFADNIGLLPKHVFRALILSDDRFRPTLFLRKLKLLFTAMSEPDGIFGEHTIKYFNGGLFDSDSLIAMDLADLAILHEAASKYNWSHVAPEIFGTLFERSLNAERRSLIGAHYTSAEDILLLVEPVVMRPLTARWHQIRASILTLLKPQNPGAPGLASETWVSNSPGAPSIAPPSQAISGSTSRSTSSSPKPQTTLYPSNPQAESLLAAWFDELSQIRILDPACGSGNFLYVALRRLLDLWNEARTFAIDHNLQLATGYAIQKMVSPQQLFGIEIEFYAHELASIVVWIGFLQWKRENSILDQPEPILQKLDNIQHADAILRYDPEGKPYEPQWPPADFIIGNPPFLGGKLLRRELGDRYVDDLLKLYLGRVRAESDLVAYWFENARRQIELQQAYRVGLLATQAIRGGANRAVLKRIQSTAQIFWAWSDRNWLLAGANVHVSMVAFSLEPNQIIELNGEVVTAINPDLTVGIDVTTARRLTENKGICYMGTTKVGSFQIGRATAEKMLATPVNPNGRLNSDVVKPWINAKDFSSKRRGHYIIDFGVDTSETDAAFYEMPFEYLREHVLPSRRKSRRKGYKEKWWLHGEPRPELRRKLLGKTRYILTPSVSKHRIFQWFTTETVADHAIFAFAREDDYFIGVLSSHVHEIWARSQGTQLREVESGFRYTPRSTFDTFPFPWPPGTEPSEADSPLVFTIAEAARNLVKLRDAWLNPPGASESDLKDRTLTKLYNLRAANKCAWLENAHRTLDQAVLAAYNWPPTLTTQQILANLLELNQARSYKSKGQI